MPDVRSGIPLDGGDDAAVVAGCKTVQRVLLVECGKVPEDPSPFLFFFCPRFDLTVFARTPPVTKHYLWFRLLLLNFSAAGTRFPSTPLS